MRQHHKAHASLLTILRFPIATPLRQLFLAISTILLLTLASVVHFELTTSHFQSQLFSSVGQQLYFWTDATPNPDLHFPATGPYDLRLGYTHIPTATERLTHRGYEIAAQTYHSPTLQALLDHGLYPPFPEKTRAGLHILDRNDHSLYKARFPEHGFESFDDIPELIIRTLLFIEDRNLLDDTYPNHNPAVSWKRFASASLAMASRYLGLPIIGSSNPNSGSVHGGSTLATQLEKFRHSHQGLTKTGPDKLIQMTSASLRAYLDGPDTTHARQRIVLDYINSVPLAAVRGHGEVHGLLDGLRAWFDTDPHQLIQLFHNDRPTISTTQPTTIDPDHLQQQATAYRKVLSLMLAHRRPSYYLVQNPDDLHDLTDQYLRVLANHNIISESLRDAALLTRIDVKRSVPPPPTTSFVERKAVDRIRTHMLSALDIKSLYDLDRFDLTVKTTIDATAQKEVSDILGNLQDPVFASSLGLMQPGRLLTEDNDLTALVYSFTLYESTPDGNVLRVQADSYDQPLNINEQIKLDLGSTAKLRTLVTYLEVFAELHTRFHNLSTQELTRHAETARDSLTRWAANYFAREPEDKSLQTMLDAAMNRYYSASPSERFFTGGGLHKFSNFNNRRNYVMTVHEAFQHSVNLPFIRMMRDIVLYYTYLDADRVHRILNDPDDVERRQLLERFADQEGQTFQERFIQKYQGKSPSEILALLPRNANNTPRRLTPRQLAAAYRAVAPAASFRNFAAYIRQHTDSNLSDARLTELYETHAPGNFNLTDQAYLARVHPLELWTAHYLRQNPTATRTEIINKSHATRQEVYAWLFKTNRKHQQDRRIKTLLEEDAFVHIHHAWKRLGYPFDSLVPSYATSIGSSADRPDSLAELVGILQNDGLRLPTLRVTNYEFASNTPYETALRRASTRAERVLPPEVARTARTALREVVQLGTARRLNKSFVTHDGTILEVGGKTGTGDHHIKRNNEIHYINRTATFVFFIDQRFYGTLTVFVPGEQAAKFRFTSALTTQLLSALAPALMPVLDPTTPPTITNPEAIPSNEALLLARNLVAQTITRTAASARPSHIPPGLPSWQHIFAARLNSAPTDYSPDQYVLEPHPQAPPSTTPPLPSWPEIFGGQLQDTHTPEPVLTGNHI